MQALPCQRALFDIPQGVAYFDGAAYSPLPRTVAAAGRDGIASKSRPWDRDPAAGDHWAERARAAAACVVGARQDDVAIVSSVAAGMTVALENLPVPPGARLLRVADEFPSVALALDRLARERGATVDVVARPADGDWAAAILTELTRSGAPPVAIAALTPLHWTDGSLIDLHAVAPALRGQGAALVVDATQAAGALPIDVAALRPDFLTFPTYKWLLGPYSLAFLYAAPHRQDGRPLHEHGANQCGTARRFDKGERNDPTALPMAALGVELVNGWTPQSVSAGLAEITTALAGHLERWDVPVAPARQRAPHILGVRLPGHRTAAAVQALAAHRVFVSDRQGWMRISPHVWADEADVAQFGEAVRSIMQA